MSESDSDLDYESADEISEVDLPKNSTNVIIHKQQKETDEDLHISVDSIESKACVADSFKEDRSCPYDVVKESLNEVKNKEDFDGVNESVSSVFSEGDSGLKVETKCLIKEKPSIEDRNCPDDVIKESLCNVENKEDHSQKVNESVSSVSSEGESGLKVEAECFAKEKPSENDTKEKVSDGQVEFNVNKHRHEKQRVTLRLEKKLQLKNQLPKENSVENNAEILENLNKKSDTKSSWGFGGWGSSLISTAASSVSTFTNQVSQGIGTVLETVENTIGAPSPEELAVSFNKKKESEEKEETRESSPDKGTEDEVLCTEEKEENIHEIKSSILPNVSSWTKVLENTGSKVLMGGLDTLELIGKKTFDIITEGDPGLRKKRAAFSDGITLSQILREAKAEADESKQIEDSGEAETVHYSQMFDEYQGLVHLEALEMLSKQSQMKIQRLLMRVARTADIRKTLEEIKSICENIPPLDDHTDCEDFEDFETVCKKHILELNLAFNIENIIKTQKRITDVVKSYENVTTNTSTQEEIYHSAICCLAEFTAKSMETFHKLAELILVKTVLEPSVEHFATNLTGLATVMCIEINNVSTRYHRCLESLVEQSENENSGKINITSTVTNLYLEASNSNKYIQDAFLLLVPVLQVSLLEASQ